MYIYFSKIRVHRFFSLGLLSETIIKFVVVVKPLGFGGFGTRKTPALKKPVYRKKKGMIVTYNEMVMTW